MKIWVAKHALVYGVEPYYVDDAAVAVGEVFVEGQRLREGYDWFRSQTAAIARADDLRNRKIASLKRQIAKLEKMEFAP